MTTVMAKHNELDNMLQNLSNSGFSEQSHVERRSEMMSTTQTFTESSTMSMSSNETTTINGFHGGERQYPGSVSRSMSSESKKYVEESSTVTHDGGFPNASVVRSPPQPQFSTSSVEQRNMSSSSVTSRNEFSSSSATKELDDLMMALNFRAKDGPADEPVPTTLDSMLCDLQQDLDKQGIRGTQKGICSACQKAIIGQVVTAIGKTFHPEHFVCTECNQELGSQNFFERGGQPYCERDYHKMFSPRCESCEGPILDKCVSAMGKTWHPEHFVCAGADCRKEFGDDGYHERNGQAFCAACYYSAFGPRCGGCRLPITENYITSLDRTWHPACFVCAQCKQPFRDGNFYEHNGLPYCELHCYDIRESPCAGCGKLISGRCITAMFRKFHPEHFVCSFCLKQLNKGTFKEKDDKPYCHGCNDRLFG